MSNPDAWRQDPFAAAYPETHFAIIDSVVEEPNVANLVFAEEQGSFLVGALAGTALRHAEAANVAHLAGTAGTGLHNEVERTTARHTRAWFVDYHKRLRAGEGELERAIGQ